MYKTKEELMTAVIKCLPYSEQITDLDFTSQKEAIYLTWRRDNRFKISLSGFVEQVSDDGNLLTVSDVCILLRELIKRQHISEELAK